MEWKFFFEKNVKMPDGQTPLEKLYGAKGDLGPEQLRITDAELLAEGIPLKKLEDVRRCLLQAVNDSPELNVWPTLVEMARSLKDLV